jgi:hypothetical protein
LNQHHSIIPIFSTNCLRVSTFANAERILSEAQPEGSKTVLLLRMSRSHRRLLAAVWALQDALRGADLLFLERATSGRLKLEKKMF